MGFIISVVDVEAKGYKHYHYDVESENTEYIFGGIVEIRNSFGIIYGSKKSNEKAQIKMDIFRVNNGRIILQKTKIIEGNMSVYIKGIRTVKYGKNILLSYMTIDNSSYIRLEKKTEIEEKADVFYSLTNLEGDYIIKPMKSKEKNMNFDDELREMRQGSYVSPNSNLKVT